MLGCQAELGDTARVAELSFVLLGWSCIGWLLWDLCECQAEFGNIVEVTDKINPSASAFTKVLPSF